MSLIDKGQNWGIDHLVSELRSLRLQSLESRQRRRYPQAQSMAGGL